MDKILTKDYFNFSEIKNGCINRKHNLGFHNNSYFYDIRSNMYLNDNV